MKWALEVIVVPVRDGRAYAAPEEDPPDLAILADLVDDGRLTPTIAATYPLTGVAAAVNALAARQVRGKIVVTAG